MHIAYFVNQYPKVSHSFIRREILALERQRFQIERIALRGWDAELVDEEDVAEQKKTRYVLRHGMFPLLFALIRNILFNPFRFLKTLALVVKIGSRADRPFPYHLIYLAEACRILPWLKKAKVSHVHAHFGTNPAEVVMLVRSLGGPGYSFTVHGPEEFDRPQFLRLKEKARSASFVVAISSYGRSQLYRWLDHEDWPKVEVVHCGLEQAFYDIKPVPFLETPRLVCVGRICEQKGQLLLIEALHQLVQRGVDLHLVLAGDGEMRSEVEALIAKYRLEGKVRITGWISATMVREEILTSRGLVLPSFAEGLPVVIMEALALRRPVLTTYVAGIPELVRHHENGWLFPAGSVDDLVVAMAELLAAPKQRLEKMGEAGHRRVVSRHSIDTEAAKLAHLFRKVAG